MTFPAGNTTLTTSPADQIGSLMEHALKNALLKAADLNSCPLL